MEADNATIVVEAAKEMDEMIANVMPDTWMGHARLAVVEEYDLSPKDRADALDYTEQLVEEHDNYPSAKVLNTVVEKMDIN